MSNLKTKYYYEFESSNLTCKRCMFKTQNYPYSCWLDKKEKLNFFTAEINTSKDRHPECPLKIKGMSRGLI